MVFEGIDGSGTTTQCRLIAERLRARGHRVVETREPSPGAVGRLTRELLADDPERPRSVDPACLALLFAADRLEHLRREILPALDDGQIVLCDRYVVSSWVYQSLDCDPQWVRAINREARWPDLTFVFDLPAEVGLARVASRRAQTDEAVERFDLPATQRRLAAGYAEVLARGPSEGLRDLVRVDASASIEAVGEAIFAELLRRGL
nr:dTMP kinase [Pseudenhygromyxa sp. WMMC2535]